MERVPSNESGTVGDGAHSDASSPSSVSDILYLINSYHSTVLRPEILRTLDGARLLFVRGDIRSALSSVDKALGELAESEQAYRDVIAFRLFVASMVGEDSQRWAPGPDAGSADRPDALRTVTLCVESDEHWHSGSLMQGLALSRSAVEHSRDVAPIWRVYADLLLAKKLSDVHAHLQADRVICGMDILIDSSGLLVFGSLPEALRSVLHLQAGRFQQAIDSAATAVRISEETSSAIGVKLALSVAATAHLARAEYDRAAELLRLFHAKTGYYALVDSLARAAFAEVALVSAREGPRMAADRIRANWHLLAMESGCIIEDPSRPAWLIGVARRAGATDLAENCLRAIEKLADNNRGFAPLEMAAERARTAWAGGEPELSTILDRSAGRSPRAAASRLSRAATASSGSTPPPQVSRPADSGRAAARRATGSAHRDVAEPDTVASRPHGLSPIPSLSDRESEVARLVGQGMTNQQAAKKLGLSPHTVNFHLRNVFRKLSISTRVKLGPIIARIDGHPGSGDNGPAGTR
ncbi:LuxR C-terminal-related transcriptional regulator [Streptomyces sp. NPDC048669]|uniref:helix-turn-helix transcriptional regulator n=1 Tax=Streptomyces sp. NPDC048669 TaxID=3155267 RepID=UPI0034441374